MNFARAAASIAAFGNQIFTTVDNNLLGGMFRDQANFHHTEQEFVIFITKYGRHYATKEEYQMRFTVFKKNLEWIENNDTEKHGEVGLNEYADWTDDEWNGTLQANFPKERDHPEVQQRRNADQYAAQTRTSTPTLATNRLPNTVDWVKTLQNQGGRDKIRQQGQCGSCWSFGTTAAMEFYNWQAGGRPFTELSVQHLLDCDVGRFNKHCQGGQTRFAFQFTAIHAIVSERDYPYLYERTRPNQNRPQACRSTNGRRGVKTSPYIYLVRGGNKQQIMAALVRQPVAMGLQANSNAFRFVKGNQVITNPQCGTQPNHQILGIGYGQFKDYDGRSEYFVIIKNSHGTGWGNRGYGYVSMNQQYHQTGICGLLNGSAVYTSAVGRY